MPIIGIVADDVTGATTSGVLLARSEVSTGVFFDEVLAENSNIKHNLDSIIISSNSRSMSREQAYKRVKKSTLLLKKMGSKYFSKRIDTTFRGAIGVEVDAMLDELGEEYIAVIVPAMPESKRILVGGYSIIDNMVLVETDVANDVKTPVKESYIPKLISSQTKRKVGHIGLNSVLLGENKIIESVLEKVAKGVKLLILDSITESHINTIAKALIKTDLKILSVDPGPFTNKLAFNRGIAKVQHSRSPKISNKNYTNTVIVCVGSATAVTKSQIEYLLKDSKNKKISLDPYKLIDKDSKVALEEIKRGLYLAMKYLNLKKKPKSIVIETAISGQKIDLRKEDKKRNYICGKCSERINISIGLLASEIYQNRPSNCISGIYCTGGDTMLNVCRQMGVSMIEVKDYIEPQVDVSFQVGVNDGLPMVGKGGLTGSINIVNKIIDRINAEYLYKRGKK